MEPAVGLVEVYLRVKGHFTTDTNMAAGRTIFAVCTAWTSSALSPRNTTGVMAFDMLRRRQERRECGIGSPGPQGIWIASTSIQLKEIAMTKNSNIKAEVTTSDDLSQEQVEKIRQRAFELYEARGREEGHDIDDWLQAEAEIEASRTRTAKA